MVIFLFYLYIFVGIQHSCFADMVFALDPCNSVIRGFAIYCAISFVLHENILGNPIRIVFSNDSSEMP